MCKREANSKSDICNVKINSRPKIKKMKSKLVLIIVIAISLFFPKVNFGQAPVMGTADEFVIFTSVGAVTNSGLPYLTRLTGNVGTNSGSSTGFGNVDGDMCDGNPQSAQAAIDVLALYNELNIAIPTFFPLPLMGSGQILVPGVHLISTPATLNLDLIFDALGDPTAVFIVQINGTFATAANSKVKLVNGALACNIFWKVEGAVSMASGTSMKGTVIANNAAIAMSVGDTLEGRLLSTNGGITLNNLFGYTPIGCGSAVLTGPLAPNLASTACYAIFTSIGPVNNSGITTVVGDIGTNSALTLGYNPLLVTGMIHPVPDASTAACAADLANVYSYLNALPADIILLYPALFGRNLELTPHTYLMNAAVTFTDTLYLNAQGDPNAVFVIQVNGAFGTSVNSRVVLTNGAQAENVYWKIDGAVSINDFSIFNGTIVCAGAIDLTTGVQLNGRALTVNGAISTTAVDVIMPLGCGTVSAPLIIIEPNDQIACVGDSVSFIVTATGTGLTYQWRRGSVNLVDGGNISGATNDTLTIDPVGPADFATDYNVIVNGLYSPSDTSMNVSLTMTSGASITMQPVDQSICLGDSVSFFIATSDTGLTYQWRDGLVNLINGGNISGATSDTLTIDPAFISDTSSFYNVIVSGGCGGDTSINVSLQIATAPIIVLNPADQTICVGDSVSFVITSTGTGLTYQWRDGSTNLINGGNISGATNDTLTINPVTVSDSSSFYNVIVMGGCSLNDTSNNVSLTVTPLPIAIATSNSPVCTADSLNLFAQTVAGATYAWSHTGGFSSIMQNPSIVSAAMSDAGTYTLFVTANGCTSLPATVNVVVTNCTVDLTVVKTVNNTSPIVGTSVIFTIIASNIGMADATGVVVTDILQSGYTYVSSTVTAGIYDPLTGDWTIGNLNSGTSETLTITVTVNATGIYTNTAGISGNEIDPSLSDNTSTTETFPTEFHIPEGFSPNGDGINDVFVILGINNYPENKFEIFNRWGNKVFKASPYTNTWDGKATEGLRIGGDELPVGTYFYVLDLGDGSEIFKGTIYLNK